MNRDEAAALVPTLDGTMDGWWATSGPSPTAAVILCPDIFGVTAQTRKIARRIAREGYSVLALNLFYRTAPRVELANDDAGRARGLSLLNQLRRESVVADLESAMAHLRSRQPQLRRFAVLGLSSGGHVAYLAACKLNIQLAVSFYGGWITNTDIPLSQPEPTLRLTPEMGQRGARLLYFVGGNDFLITSEQRERIERALAENAVRHEVIVYSLAGHAFLSEEPEVHDPAASADAWQRTFRALKEELTPPDAPSAA